MSPLDRGLEGTPAGVAYSSDAKGLSAFLQRECGAAIWTREIPDTVRTWLDGVPSDTLPRGRMVLPADDVAGAIAHLCDASGLAPGTERTWLRDDIAHLAVVFADLMDVRFLRLRLDVINTNACRKFHVDAIRARLLCTYRGTGTQYGHAGPGEDPVQISTAPTGAPVLLRGSLWPPRPAAGLLHRSPPIEGTGETRLVLVLDPATEDDRRIFQDGQDGHDHVF